MAGYNELEFFRPLDAGQMEVTAMNAVKMAKVGVYVDRTAAELRWNYGINVFTNYVAEILTHAGIPWQLVEEPAAILPEKYDIVLLACTPEDQTSGERLISYAEAGGTLVSYGNAAELAEAARALVRAAVPCGYAQAEAGTATEAAVQDYPPLRFFAGQPWEPSSAASVKLRSGRIAYTPAGDLPAGDLLQAYALGQGELHRWAVDIPTTVVTLQQGSGPVLSDGTAAPDGTAQVREGILKADDRIALDWDFDRRTTATGLPYFAHPYADFWRELLIGHLLRIAADKGLTLPFFDAWPDGVQHVAHISLDSDTNIDESADVTLRLLQENDIRATWCLIEPGYSPAKYPLIREDGHELALHYNALPTDDGSWGHDEFVRQVKYCAEAIGTDDIRSNKNHFTIYHGWGELFNWLEEAGIEADQTRGPSKRGNLGFIFGTCHPYFPMALWNERNRVYNVLEIGFLTQDMDAGGWGDTSIIDPFLDGVARVRGVAHFLFHPYHFYTKDPVCDALALLAAKARARAFEFWTSAELNDWVRRLRGLRITDVDDAGRPVVEDAANPPERRRDGGEWKAKAPVVWVPIPEKFTPSVPEAQIAVRFGRRCIKHALTEENALAR